MMIMNIKFNAYRILKYFSLLKVIYIANIPVNRMERTSFQVHFTGKSAILEIVNEEIKIPMEGNTTNILLFYFS